MEVVSSSNLVPSKNEKITTACNLVSSNPIATNSSVMPHDLMRGQVESYA